jgi:hypothetical protein
MEEGRGGEGIWPLLGEGDQPAGGRLLTTQTSDDHPSEEEQLALPSPIPFSTKVRNREGKCGTHMDGWMDLYGNHIRLQYLLGLDRPLPLGGGDRLFPFPIPFLPYFYDDEKRKKVILGTDE